jgi:hypothetical protein
MAVTTGTMMALSAGISMAGQMAQGRAARKAGEIQAQADERIAAQQQDQALQEADRIHRQGRRVQGAARAQYAASGVDVSQGAPVATEGQIGADSERDARMTLLTGQRQADSTRFAAGQARARGANAQSASTLGAITTGLQGWKGVKQEPAAYRYQVPDYPGAEY